MHGRSLFPDGAKMISFSLAGQLETQLQRRRKYIAATIRSQRRQADCPDQHIPIRRAEPGADAMAGLLSDAEIALLRNKPAEPNKIQAALQRIKTHTYGNCLACGAAIAPQRLRIHPTAERCQSCQAALESSQRQGLAPNS